MCLKSISVLAGIPWCHYTQNNDKTSIKISLFKAGVLWGAVCIEVSTWLSSGLSTVI